MAKFQALQVLFLLMFLMAVAIVIPILFGMIPGACYQSQILRKDSPPVTLGVLSMSAALLC